MGVSVQRATLADVEGILDVFMDAFSDDYFQTLFPPRDGLGREYQRKAWRGFLTTHERGIQEAQVWVVRGDEGVVQSVMLLWIVRPEDGGAWAWTRRYPPVDPGLDKAKVDDFFEGMDAQHHRVMHDEPHVYLELMMTHSAARRRGHASALLRHASAVADERDDVLYLDSEANARGLYERQGYVQQGDVERTSIMYPMVRARRSEREG